MECLKKLPLFLVRVSRFMCLNMVTRVGGSIALPRMSGDLPAVISIGGTAEVPVFLEKDLSRLLLNQVA